MHLGDVLISKVGMEQCKASSCVFLMIRDDVVVMIVCVYIDYITVVAAVPEACDFLNVF